MKDEADNASERVLMPRTLSQRLAVVGALIASIGPAILWPGDTPWVYDEPA